MRHIQRDLVPAGAARRGGARPPYTILRRLHGDAYGWEPPDVPGLERLGATRMRQYVRAWINEWDLVRLDPRHGPVTDVVDVPGDYREVAELDDGP